MLTMRIGDTLLSGIRELGRKGIAVWGRITGLVVGAGKSTVLILQTFQRVPLARRNWSLTMHQMLVLGSESIPLVAAVSIFVGAEVVLQASYQFAGIIPLRYLGVAVCKSIILEFGPVFTSIVVAGRSGTSIAAEIGLMKATDQLDAMECLVLDPIRFLVVPRVLACTLMVPVVVIIGEAVAIVTSVFTVRMFVDLSLYSYGQSLRLYFSAGDVGIGILKSAIFGFIMAIVGVYQGMNSKKDAAGIGESTTGFIVVTSVLILVMDFLVGYVTS